MSSRLIFSTRRFARLGLGLIPIIALASACGDDSPGTDGGTDGTGNPSTGITLSGATEETTGPGDTTAAEETTGSVDTTGGGTNCETLICGSECCDEGDECVGNTCLPPCDSGIRCGEDQSVCCDDGQVCLNPECVTPGADCLDSYDCPEGEFCEPTLGKTGQCLPQQDPVACEIQPLFTEIDLQLEWSWEEDEVISVPAVADIDGDGLPEVVINTFNVTDPGGATDQFRGEIVVLDGTTGLEEFRISEDLSDPLNPSFGSYSRTTIAIGDVDGNDLPDIIYTGRPRTGIAPFAANSSQIYAVNGLGMPLWESHAADDSPYYVYVRQGAITLANLDADDASEIIIGATIIDDDGLVVFDIDQGDLPNPNPALVGLRGGVFGSNVFPANPGDLTGRGGVSAVADLTGDGVPEVISGHDAWSISWVQPGVGNPTVTLTPLWSDDAHDDGYPAIADIDLDGDPEVIIAAAGTVRILDGQTGQLWCGIDIDGDGSDCAGNDALRTQPIAIPGVPVGRGGPPTVADFDGDGRPEVAVAGGGSYSLYDFYRDGETVVQANGFPPAAPGEIFVRWTSDTQDISSNATGSSVFDFQGDGPAEVIYNDECFLRVYDGATGNILVEEPNPSATIREYPIVVDADGDNNSELIVVANDVNAAADCVAGNPGYVPRQGVFVYGDANDQWVRTRAVWTQHTYHVTNATGTGLTPPVENDNWSAPNLNNYRQNVQGAGVFNAPDLEVDLSVGTSTCLDEQFEIVATVRNTGSTGVPAGIGVTLYEGADASGTVVSSQTTLVPMLPGASIDLLWLVPAPGGVPLQFFVEVDIPDNMIAECNEDNNTNATMSVACPDAG
jgi:hypothetical protein